MVDDMTEEIKTITNDLSEIASIHDDAKCVTIHIVGANGITKIEAYKEPWGESNTTYLAIIKGDYIFERIPAMGLRITYKS